MSLSHTALRLAAIEALYPFGATAFPTFAGKQVLDSHIAPVAMDRLEPGLPVIVVTTDAAKVEGQGGSVDVTLPGDGREMVTLAFEIMVFEKGRNDKGEAVKFVAPTDAFTKATLDLLCSQILQRLSDARMNGPLQHILVAIDRVESQPYSDPDTDILISATRLELSCRVHQQARWPDPPQAGLARLPSPLREVAEALPAESYGRKVAEGLADLIGNPATFPALAEIRLAANLARSAEDAPAPPADASETPPAGDVGGSVTF